MLIAAADGRVEPSELEVLAELLHDMSDGQLSQQQALAALRQSAGAQDDWEARIDKLARAVTSDEDRATTLTAVAVVMLADGEVEEGDEYELYVLLADAFGYDQEQADALLEEVSEGFEDEDDDAEDDEEDDGEDDGEDDEEDDEEGDEEEAPAARPATRAVGKAAPAAPARPGLMATTLRRGDRGPAVVQLQNGLNNVGGYGLRVDGVFGANTEQAVRHFQSNAGLKVDGLVGANTRAALGLPVRVPAVTHAAPATPAAAPPRPAATPPARRPATSFGRGARGDRVSIVQLALSTLGYNLSIDGIFGPATERAVMHFQRDNGLAVDGLVGPRTWALLAPYGVPSC